MPKGGQEKRPWFTKLFRYYVARSLRKNFADVRLLGAESLEGEVLERGFILASNHVAWWDPLLLIHLDAHLKTDGYCLMDLGNLRQFSFFRWLGALPLNRGSSLSAYRDLKRAAEDFPKKGRMLVIFPQGRQRPAHLPLELRSGVAVLAEASGVPVLPMAIRYDFSEGPRALVHLSLGAAISPPLATPQAKGVFLRRLERSLTEELRHIDAALLEDVPRGISLLGRENHADRSRRRTILSKVLHLSASRGER